MDYKKMGSVIKKRRNALRITQEQLAEMINKSTVYISLIESGSRHPSLETLYTIAMSLNTSIDTIIYDKASSKNDEHVDEFSFLLADRSEEEIGFIMNIVREILRHLVNGRLTKLRRNTAFAGSQKRWHNGAKHAGAGSAAGAVKYDDGFDDGGGLKDSVPARETGNSGFGLGTIKNDGNSKLNGAGAGGADESSKLNGAEAGGADGKKK